MEEAHPRAKGKVKLESRMLALGNLLRFHFKKLTLKFCRLHCLLESIHLFLHQKLLDQRMIRARARRLYVPIHLGGSVFDRGSFGAARTVSMCCCRLVGSVGPYYYTSNDLKSKLLRR